MSFGCDFFSFTGLFEHDFRHLSLMDNSPEVVYIVLVIDVQGEFTSLLSTWLIPTKQVVQWWSSDGRIVARSPAPAVYI